MSGPDPTAQQLFNDFAQIGAVVADIDQSMKTLLGPIEIELIQPLAGESIWADYLAEHGPGLHHIRFNVPEVAPVVAFVAGQGIGVTQQANGIRPGTSWVNFDTEQLVGFTLEVMRPVPGTSGRPPAVVAGQVIG